jgi:peptide/nickel transport system substrate-binding protein
VHPPRSLLVPLLLTVVIAACTGADAPDTADPARDVAAVASEPATPTAPPIEGGTVVYGAGVAPSTLNPWLAPATDTSAVVTRPLLAPLWRVTPDGDYEPWLLAGEPAVSGGSGDAPFTVVYELRDDAEWSDGQPIDGADVLFTLDVCRRLLADGAGDPTCAAVDPQRSTADGRRATIVFERPVAAWRTLLALRPVLPEHILAGADLATAGRDRVPVSSGPFVVAAHDPGVSLTLERNDRWWGDPPALDRLVFAFGMTDGVDDVLDRRVDVVAGDAALGDVERARAGDGVRVAVAPDERWDAIDFNLGSERVARPAVRRALADALDRSVVRDELIAPIAPAVVPRGGLLVPPGDDDAATAGPGGATGDPATALAGAGCVRDADGMAVCDGRPMRLTLARVGGRWRHRIIAEYVAAQLAQVGVQVDVVARSARRWDLRIATVTPDLDTAGTGDRWRCDAAANTQGFCRPDYDVLLDRAARTTDPQDRGALVDEAERLLRRTRPTVPLFGVPTMLLARDDLRGPTADTGPWGPTWNTEEWARTAR